MKRIAITGNSCSGLHKASEVCGLIDVPVFQADLALKFLLNWREDILSQIRIQFGYNVFVNGTASPQKFDSSEKFDRLIDIAEVDLLLMWESFCDKHSGSQVVAYNSHIVFERGLNDRFDAVVNIYRPQRMRAHDLARQKNISFNQALAMTAQEMDESEKTKKSDYVIHNYDSLSLLTQFEVVRSQVIKGLKPADWTNEASLPATGI
jgi:dephospho-CoA kinase